MLVQPILIGDRMWVWNGRAKQCHRALKLGADLGFRRGKDKEWTCLRIIEHPPWPILSPCERRPLRRRFSAKTGRLTTKRPPLAGRTKDTKRTHGDPGYGAVIFDPFASDVIRESVSTPPAEFWIPALLGPEW